MKGDNSGTRKMPQLPAHDCEKNTIIPPGDAVNSLIPNAKEHYNCRRSSILNGKQ
ncbi:hypothetical protein WMO13_02265 [Ignatzschineria larvae DSM 13226]|uniref:Uncharacterized protein n=1 Tax=Ignatzschineria larvae DSM 13226 TaxID=1111732 RepID=A0ABZ3C0T2_9GAMM|nr:hypothetical protein [Ignatzschineria larvae]